MADAAAFLFKDVLALVRIAAFLEKLRRDEVTNQPAHLLMVERNPLLPGAERMAPQGRGEVGEAVTRPASLQRETPAMASRASLRCE